MGGREEREAEALKNIERFADRVRELIRGITLDKLLEEGGLNPYMVAALGVDDIRDLVRFFVYKRAERSLGTSFGNVIEAFLRDLLGGKSGKDADPACRGRGRRGSQGAPWVCWWDIVVEGEFERGGKRYRGVVISVKSGPADINKDIIETFLRHAAEAEANGYRPYLVLTYGKRAFNVAESTLRGAGVDPREILLVGRDVFREFFGDPGYYDRVIDLMRSAARKVDISRLIEERVDELTAELKERFGGDISEILKRLS